MAGTRQVTPRTRDNPIQGLLGSDHVWGRLRRTRDAVRAVQERSARSGARICFCHVPKCAGSSISRAIDLQMFGLRQRALLRSHAPNIGASRRAAAGLGADMMVTRTHVAAYHLALPTSRYVHGHFFAPPGLVDEFHDDWIFVTILRDPVRRWISEYVYNTAPHGGMPAETVERYLGRERSRWSGRTFVNTFASVPAGFDGDRREFAIEALHNLRRFHVVGVVEDLDGWQERFRAAVGKPLDVPRLNASPNRDLVDEILARETVVERVRELCAADLAVYEGLVEAPAL